MKDRVVLVSGASSGIGRACALHLSQLGYRVYGTSRSGGMASDIATVPFRMLALDLAKDEGAESVVEEILSREGRLDVVVNNAGMGIAGPVECTPLDEARRQFEVNFFGALRLSQAALPAMRRQRWGYIVNIGSIGGLIALPFQAMYSASKFALEGLSEALRLEVRPFGIRVVLIEPGDHMTAFTSHRRRLEIAAAHQIYCRPCSAALERMEDDERHGPEPERVARLLSHILALEQPRLRYTTGHLSQRAATWMKRWLPNSLVEYGLRRYYRLSC